MGGIVDGALGGAIGAGIVGLFGLFVWLPLVKAFKDPSKAEFQAMRQMLETEWAAAQRYRTILGAFLGSVDRFFDGDAVNPSPWSAMTYDRLLGLAIAYPVLSAFLIWIFCGQAGALGEAVGFMPFDEVSGRFWAFATAFSMLVGIFLRIGSVTGEVTP